MDFKEARRRMVDSQVRTNDVTDLRVQAALELIPREDFVPADKRDVAYIEREIAIAPGRVLLTARDFSKLAAAAEPRASDLVLIAGAGTGYAAAVFSRLVEMVVAVEGDAALAAQAQETINRLEIGNAVVLNAEAADGAARQGPFDLIFVDGGIEKRPDALLAQLREGGRLAAIQRINGVFRGVVWRRSGDAFACAEKFDATTRMVLPGFAAEKAFVF